MGTDLTSLPAAAQRWGIIAAVLGAVAVALGAFGAHMLPKYLGIDPLSSDRRLDIWETAARYQMYHAFALLAVAWLASRGSSSLCMNLAGVFFLAGTLIFSGCLYVLVLSGVTFLGRIVPIGGVLMIAGWVALAISFLRAGR